MQSIVKDIHDRTATTATRLLIALVFLCNAACRILFFNAACRALFCDAACNALCSVLLLGCLREKIVFSIDQKMTITVIENFVETHICKLRVTLDRVCYTGPREGHLVHKSVTTPLRVHV